MTERPPHPPNPTRRAFLKGSGLALAGTLTGLAVGSAGCGPASDSPAYQYWRRKEKGGLTDQEYIVMCGTLAANAHNTQPWKLRLGQDRIEILADSPRHLGAADPRRRLMAMGVGCALENMRVAAESLGYRALADVQADRAVHDNGLCAVLHIARAGNPNRHPWFDALFLRRTTRTAFEDAPIPSDFRESLLAACTFPGLGISWREGAAARRPVSDVVSQAVRRFLGDDQRHRDGMRWFRITRREWEEKGDGISIFTSDVSLIVKQWVEWIATPEDLLGESFKEGEIEYVDRTSAATPLWGLVWSERAHPAACLRAGQVAERVYLEATARGYAVCPVSYPTELAETVPGLRQAFGLGADVDPLWLFRVGRAPRLEKSVRRHLGDVIV